MNKRGLCVLSTGGTGGHVLPCVALATELHNIGWEVIIFSDVRGAQYLDESSNEYSIQVVNISSKTTSLVKKIAYLTYQLPVVAYIMAKFILGKKPKFVVGFGGISTFPILFVAVLFRIPLFIQEQNAVLGRVNRFFQRFTIKVFCHFPKTLFLDRKKSLNSGNPIREEILNKSGAQYLGPGPWPITMLVLGGSQGASILSEVVPTSIAMLSKKTQQNLTVFHQARKDDVENVLSAYKKIDLRAYVRPFFDDVDRLISEAQIIVCRAGSNTLADISIVGRPAILIPLKHAKDDHQHRNAKMFSEGGAALVVEESPRLAKDIFEKLRFILKSPSKARVMANRSLEKGKPNASKDITRAIESSLGENYDSY
jgi:UDP-N-acetylglucosamine--N-acetylmuramyl-(pentapeptide) pyrophosphoryl-undecaprenol N-acetylglucosamine transferase